MRHCCRSQSLSTDWLPARPFGARLKETVLKSTSPYVNFKGNTKEAFDFDKSVFGGDFQAVVRFRDFGVSYTGNVSFGR